MLRWIKIGETKRLQEGFCLRTITGAEYTEWRDIDVVEADTIFRSGCIGPLSNVEVMAEIGRLTAENERLRAAGLQLIQHENGGDCMRQDGKPCREVEKCGCYLEFQEHLNQQRLNND